MERGARRLVAAGLLVVFFTTAVEQAPVRANALAPIPPGTEPPLQAVGIQALHAFLFRDGLYSSAEGSPSAFVGDQMMGVLVALGAPGQRPEQASLWRAEAASLWNRSLTSYDTGRHFFHKTIPAPDQSICIDVETHAWALRAAVALKAAGSAAAAVTPRLPEIRATLDDLLDAHTHDGLPACGIQGNRLNPFQVPLATLALLEARAASPDVRSDDLVRRNLDAFRQDLSNGGYPTDASFYNAELNARLLLAFSEAARAFSSAPYAAARDDLVTFIQAQIVRVVDDVTLATHVDRDGSGFRAAGSSPENQLWTAYALHAARNASSPRVQGETVGALLDGAVARFWSATAGGFASDSGAVVFSTNAIAALVAASPPISSVSLDAPSFAFKVPGELDHDFELPGGEELVLSNTWTVRFSVSANSSGTYTVLLPAQALAPVHLSSPGGGNMTSTLYRVIVPGTSRVAQSATVTAGRIDLLRFSASLSPTASPFRLDAFAPLHPTHTAWDALELHASIRNDGTDPVVIRPLRLELGATGITVRSVSINDAIVTHELAGPITTTEFPQSHLRLLLPEVTLEPGANEILVSYSDIEKPTLSALSLTRASGSGSHTEPKQTVLQDETITVRVGAHDNVALRNVSLQYVGPGRQAALISMNRTADGSYMAKITPSELGTGTLKAVAVDAARNLNETESITLTIENPLLSGSIVLLVFAATLCATALIIWVKLRRRGRTP